MKNNKLYYGAAYYDEYMPYDRIETDFQMMVDAGMNVIRIAESTWSTWEPREGEFDFTHLHRMLKCALKYKLDVIIGTPTYAIPAWLANKADDILALTHGGQNLYGPRQNMDITHPIYLHHAEIMIRRLLEEVKDYPNVIGFQIDNETKSYDVCSPRAQQMFKEEMKKKFPDLKDFNHEFGFDYWSNRINEWDQFPDVRQTINQSLAAEYAAFQRQLVTNFLSWQANIIDEYRRPDQFVTQNFDFEWHNYSFGLQPEVDQYQASKCLTVAGGDIYHPSQDDLTGKEITTCGNIIRGLHRDNYFILETEAQGLTQWLSYPGQLRLQAYSHIGNGSNMVEYWHWHSIHNAIESYWKGVLSHDLAPNRTYRECSVVGNEWKRIGSHLVNLKKKNKIAVVADNASLTALTQFPTATKQEYSYNTILRWLCDGLYDLNVEFDIIPAAPEQFEFYDMLLVPALYSASDRQLQALDSFVTKGGSLLTTFKTAFSDEHLKIYTDTQPHLLSKALGLHYDQFTHPKDVTVSFNGVESQAQEWMELVTVDTATSLANYKHKAWKDYSAITENSYGQGHAMYLSCLFGEDTLKEVLKHFMELANIDEPYKLPVQVEEGIVVKQGINDLGKHIMYFLNYSSEPKTFTYTGEKGLELLSEKQFIKGQTMTLEGWDLAIIES